MSEIVHLKDVSIVKDGVRVRVNLSRFSRQFAEAQYWLDNQIMTDMLPFMPIRYGTFQLVTRAMSAGLAGTGRVIAASPPMGRYLYEGEVMVDEVTGSPWARKGARKVLAGRPLTYSRPGAAAHWFDAAKAVHGPAWIAGVKKRAGGGA